MSRRLFVCHSQQRSVGNTLTHSSSKDDYRGDNKRPGENARKRGFRADRWSLRSTMDSCDERSITRVDQVCMRLRPHLKKAHFIVVRLVGDVKKGESGVIVDDKECKEAGQHGNAYLGASLRMWAMSQFRIRGESIHAPQTGWPIRHGAIGRWATYACGRGCC